MQGEGMIAMEYLCSNRKKSQPKKKQDGAKTTYKPPENYMVRIKNLCLCRIRLFLATHPYLLQILNRVVGSLCIATK
jgi:hypothetical protein